MLGVCGKMQSVVGNCWCSIFLDAYKYSTNYLVFSITLIIASIVCLWIYEKPQLYKFIFQSSTSKQSIISPIQSEEMIEESDNQSLISPNTPAEKIIGTKDDFKFGKKCLEEEIFRPLQ